VFLTTVIIQSNIPRKEHVFSSDGENRRKRGSHRWRLFFFSLLTLLALLPVLTLGAYLTFAQQYQRDKTLGNAGEEHLRAALSLFATWSKRPFDVAPVRQAEQEFRTTGIIMSQVQDDLPELAQLSTTIPMLGSRLGAINNLLKAARGISQAGVAGCQLLEAALPGFANPFSHTSGVTQAELGQINQLFPQVRTGVSQALDNVEQLTPNDLDFDPHLAQTFATFQHDIPQAQSVLEDVTLMLPALPSLLGVGQPANYLLEVLDSSELRPGGGFVGSDGTITLAGGHFAGARVQDVLVLDNKTKFGQLSIPFPPTYKWFTNFLTDLPSWSLRDSNLDPDFPTDARNGEENYDLEGGTADVQGMVAITPALIQQVLEVTGPIFLSEYDETVTAQNLVDLIHYHQLGAGSEGNSKELTPDGQTTLRKHFVEVLSQDMMDTLHHLSAADLGKLISTFFNALQRKDVQIYLNNPMAEKLLQDTHLADTVQAPVTGDSLFVVDANVAGNKANEFITTTMQDQVTLDNMGDAYHHLTLNYTWTTPGNIYSARGYYQDYLRLYVPPDSVLAGEQGLQDAASGSGFGRTIWSGDFRLDFGHTSTLNVTWRVPHAAQSASNGANWKYQYLLQRQAGTNWQDNVQLNLAGCASFSAPAGGVRLTQPGQAVWKSPLEKDTTLSTNYACSG
jgi:hypothetical protein